MNGIITAVHRDRYEIVVNDEIVYARLKTGVYYREGCTYEFPTVGDVVQLAYQTTGDSLIEATVPRKSCFIRKNPTPGMPDQAIAANFDYIFIVMSLNLDFNLTKLENYLTFSWQSGGTPIVILSKSDLCDNPEEQMIKAREAAIGVDVIALSSQTGNGMDQLEPYLGKDKVIVLLGSSGVGKSSLINTLMGEEVMQTNGIREYDSQGHHTTTHRQSFMLPTGTIVIDTPGMRTLTMSANETGDGVSQTFSDIEEYIRSCKFRNCTHRKEEGCAIQEAIKSGVLSEKRWMTYQKLKAQERFAEKKAKRQENQQTITKKKYGKKERREKSIYKE